MQTGQVLRAELTHTSGIQISQGTITVVGISNKPFDLVSPSASTHIFFNAPLHQLSCQSPKTPFHPGLGEGRPAGIVDTVPTQSLVLLLDSKTSGEALWLYVQSALQPFFAKQDEKLGDSVRRVSALAHYDQFVFFQETAAAFVRLHHHGPKAAMGPAGTHPIRS